MKDKNKPVRVNVQITNEELAQRINKTAKILEISQSALLRMALVEYLNKRDKEVQREKIAA